MSESVADPGTDRLLELAAATDAGFDLDVLADMLDSLSRFSDDEIPTADADAPAVRAFATAWAAEIRTRRPSGPGPDLPART